MSVRQRFPTRRPGAATLYTKPQDLTRCRFGTVRWFPNQKTVSFSKGIGLRIEEWRSHPSSKLTEIDAASVGLFRNPRTVVATPGVPCSIAQASSDYRLFRLHPICPLLRVRHVVSDHLTPHDHSDPRFTEASDRNATRCICTITVAPVSQVARQEGTGSAADSTARRTAGWSPQVRLPHSPVLFPVLLFTSSYGWSPTSSRCGISAIR